MTRPLRYSGYPNQDESAFAVHLATPISSDLFVPQPNDWTCGIAVAMMIHRFFKVSVPPCERCVEILQTTETHGTSTTNFAGWLESFSRANGLLLEIGHNGSYADIERLLMANWLIVLAFREPVELVGHYAIVQAIHETALMLADPFYGPRSIVHRTNLVWTTQFEEPTREGWYAALKRPEE
ncbi:MAG: Papain-like cysteine protease AvrRpt2 [Pseudomonadota bacterium]|jgi:hypothetical protein